MTVPRRGSRSRLARSSLCAAVLAASAVVAVTTPAHAIVGGTVVPGGWYDDPVPTNNPYAAVGRLTYPTKGGTSLCTGTLVAPDLVLTTAHCRTSSGQITFGVLNLSRDGERAVTRSVVSHRWSSRPELALLQLDSPVTSIAPMPVFRPEVSGLVGVGKQVEVVGWGVITRSGQATDELRRADLSISGNRSGLSGVPDAVKLESVKGYPYEGDSGAPVLSRSASGQLYVIATFDVWSRAGGSYADRLERAPEVRRIIDQHNGVPGA